MKIFKIVVKSAIIATYIGMIAILILLALTPGEKSSDISNSVGDKFNEVTPDVIEPEVPVVNVESVEIKYLTVSASPDCSGSKRLSALVPVYEKELIGLGNTKGLAVHLLVLDLYESVNTLSDGV